MQVYLNFLNRGDVFQHDWVTAKSLITKDNNVKRKKGTINSCIYQSLIKGRTERPEVSLMNKLKSSEKKV